MKKLDIVQYTLKDVPLKENYKILIKKANGLEIKVRFLFNDKHIKMGIGFFDKDKNYPFKIG